MTAVMPKAMGLNPPAWLESVGLPSNVGQDTTAGVPNELLVSVASIVDGLIRRATEQRTATEFSAIRNEVFSRYFGAMVALGALIKVSVPDDQIALLKAHALAALEADFRQSGAASFGTDLRDRAIFTVWTLRKINDLGEKMERLLPSDTTKDMEIAKQFAASAMWARFHIDCLARSIHSGDPIFPEVAEQMVDGLRAAVNAYAAIRQALDLRTETPEPDLPPIPWDCEDDELLAAADSMHDTGLEC